VGHIGDRYDGKRGAELTFEEYLESLKIKRVTVIGAGISNTPLIEALLHRGVDTTVRDKRSFCELGEAAIRFEGLGAKMALGDEYLSSINADVLFRTPGIMPTNPAICDAVSRGAVLTSEMEVFFDVCPCKTIGVTGSDGKTTTTSMIAKLLENAGYCVHTGGNIGASLLCKADSFDCDDVAVLELSSFQLITMMKSPDVAVYTNLTPNHLDVHKDMEEYGKAKRNVFIHQGRSGRAVFNLDNEYTKAEAELARGEALFFSRIEMTRDGVCLDNNGIYDVSGGYREYIMDTSDVLLPGAHNLENTMAAFAAVRGLVSNDIMKETARAFSGVKHRIELVRRLRGVSYYNDSIASSPSRTIAGLHSFGQKVILVAGGKDKGVAFDELGEEIVKSVKTLILTGMSAHQILDAVEKARGDGDSPEIMMRDGFEDAVHTAADAAQNGDVVLLSPACTSFDRFRNFEERGDVFRKIVEGLK